MSQIKDDFVGGLFVRLQEMEGVPPVTPFSRFLADCISGFRCMRAIDFGCGSGIQALLLAKRGAKVVYAVDCIDKCVDATIENAKINDVKAVVSDSLNAEMESGIVAHQVYDLSSLKNFDADLLVSNPPTMPSRMGVPLWADGGQNGRDVLDQLILDGPECISRDGQIVIVHSSLCGLAMTFRKAEERGLSYRVVCSQRIPFREWYYQCLDVFHDLSKEYDCIWEEKDGKHWEQIHVIALEWKKSE